MKGVDLAAPVSFLSTNGVWNRVGLYSMQAHTDALRRFVQELRHVARCT
jgi:hypothetical protein